MIGVVAVCTGIVGLLIAGGIYYYVNKHPDGNKKEREIAAKIHKGAIVFMRREYTYLAIFAAVLFVLALVVLGYQTALSFLVGAVSSSAAGWLGMYAATKANVRTAVAANTKGASTALSIAFFGGSIMGLCVAALGLIGLGVLFYFFGGYEDVHYIHGFGMGASLVALFSRVGGGIFTKSADVGADLVGKLEAGIPEDDPRNPGVIADNVGDNVGDVAGMGSDIYESYCGSMIAAMAIAASFIMSGRIDNEFLIAIPLLLTSIGLFSAVIGIGTVVLLKDKEPAMALRVGMLVAPLCFVIFALIAINLSDTHINVWYCLLVGAVGGMIIGLVTEYYTNSTPVREIAKAGETGPATVIIAGLATGMRSVLVPVTTLCAILLISAELAGLYGVAIAAIGMLATVGITMAVDAYGPVADNAGGIAEMANMGKKTREITDSLDEVGNTTAAIGKGFAIGAASLAALAIIAAYIETVSIQYTDFEINISNPEVLAGLFFGCLIPFFISALTMTAVGDAAFEMIAEIRRQFRDIKGLKEGTAEPDSDKCIEIATTAALKKMVLPGLIAVSVPPVIGLIFGPAALGGVLGGALVGCLLMALMMANAGGAWDNAKKFVEKGNYGGKGSDTHTATVVGDTIGDPFKDTSGPSMNILINLMAIVSLVIAPIL